MEEWGQTFLIGFLLGFVIARHRLVKESVVFSLHSTWRVPKVRVDITCTFGLCNS